MGTTQRILIIGIASDCMRVDVFEKPDAPIYEIKKLSPVDDWQPLLRSQITHGPMKKCGKGKVRKYA